VSEEKNVGAHDLLGIAAVGRAIESVADSGLRGAEALLARVCLPAAEEFGLLLRDKVSEWRRRNALATVARAQPMLESAAAEGRHAPPRLILESLAHASWSDSQDVQQMWAGLLASSCSQDGRDDSNWIFVNLLGQLTELQARILKIACETATKIVQPTGLIVAKELHRTGPELVELTGCADLQRLDRELDHLRNLGLLLGGFIGGSAAEPVADIQPSPLALHLYVRAQGSRQNPIEYFGLTGPLSHAEQGA
jgi:abortive infection alpha-like protein